MDLGIDKVFKEIKNDINIVNRMKRSLSSRFNLSHINELDNATYLSCFLVALERFDEAENILNLIVKNMEYQEDRMDLWDCFVEAALLLSYIFRCRQDSRAEKSLTKIVFDKDAIPEYYSFHKLYLEDLENHQENIDESETETHKYKCETIAGEILTFMYYCELLPYYKNELPLDLENDIELLLTDAFSKLRNTLETK